jgi:CRP-like cAMP-binding protein
MQTLSPQANVNKAEALRRTELFSSLPEDVLHKVAALATVRRLSRNEMLYSEHEEATGLFIVAEGELRSIREGFDGREQVLSTERTGATLSEVSVFGGGQYFSTVLAETPSVVLCIHNHDIRKICDEHPELLWKVAKVLSARVRLYAELIESLALRNVDQRLALFLIGLLDDPAVDARNTVEFELPLTRSEIATRIGSVREVVSRCLSHLHEIKLIDLRGKRLVIIPDVQALREFAGAIHSTHPFTSLALK